MKNKLITNILLALFVGMAIQMTTGFSALASGAVVFVAGQSLPALSQEAAKGLTFMAIQTQIWHDHIEEEIFKDNSFLAHAVRVDNDQILNNSVVHIPQSGGSGNVVKNRKSLPAQVRKRQDTDVIYLLDEYTTDPVVIPNIDTKELSYDKRNSVLGEDRDKIVQVVAEWTLYNWLNSGAITGYNGTNLPADRILNTTGDSVSATAPGASGNRKAMKITDFQTMRNKFKREDRWFEGRMYCLLTPDHESDVLPADSVVTATYMNQVSQAEREAGIIAKIQGWNIMSRSSVVLLNGNNVKAPGEASATDDDEASLFWYDQAVELAMGQTEAFEDLSNPQHYGDLYSFLLRAGGRARRSDYKGIGLLRGVTV